MTTKKKAKKRPKPANPKLGTLTTNIGGSLKEQLLNVAKEQGLTLSEIIRMLIAGSLREPMIFQRLIGQGKLKLLEEERARLQNELHQIENQLAHADTAPTTNQE